MAKVKRVFEIAKELGVDSKAIVAKCLAEGVPGIKDHMSPVKLGLEMTVREWFSGEAAEQHHTAIEQAPPVDLAKAARHAKSRRRKAGEPDHSDHAEDSSDAVTATDTMVAPTSPSAASVGQATDSTTSSAASSETPESSTSSTPAPLAAASDSPAPSIAGLTTSIASPSDATVAPTPVAATSAALAKPASEVSSGTSGGTGAIAGGGGAGSPMLAATLPKSPTTPSLAHARPASAAPAAASSSAAAAAPSATGLKPTTIKLPAAAATTATPSRPTGGTPAAPGHGRPAPVPVQPIRPAGRPNVPLRPTDVRPVGPMLQKPQEAVLRGPKVVRIERPDVIEPRRGPRRGPGGPGGSGGAGGGGSSGTGGVAGISRSKGPVRGRGAGAPAPAEEEGENKAAAGNKRRSLTTRRGRFAEALPTGPTKFSDADLAELDARLNNASGFLKQRRRDLKKHDGPGSLAQSAAITGGKVFVDEPITIKSLSAATGLKSSDIIKYLFKKGVMATINSAIGREMAVEVAMEHEIDLEVKEQQTQEEKMLESFANRQDVDVRRRPPVVTVMGHVDHGKTSLLDAIRHADVAAHEAGGITQHVGAYRVRIKGGDGQDKIVVFLDTPGHQAFTSMRARGASLTDVVVLVVAADDGVMPQTIESINHAKAAQVPIIVALNKIDKAEATESNIRKIYGQLAEHGISPVEWGGQTEVVKVSATQKTGVTELLEMLDYQAELLDLKADFGGAASGIVVEALMVPGRGSVARVLVQQGTLKVGDPVVIGRAYGRIRDLSDDRGGALTEAGPATPVELSGIDMLPNAGDKFYVCESFQKAEEIASGFRERERLKQLASQTKVTLENFSAKMDESKSTGKELRIVLKADVQGSVDVLRKSLEELGNQEVSVRVLHAAVGGVTESDILLADASEAVVIGFNVVAPAMVRDLAEQRHIEIRTYRIIYEITDDIKKALEGMLEPEVKEEILGAADVREVFKITKVGSVAGCMVVEGEIKRGARMRLIRDNVVITDNREIESLRRLKDDAKEVRTGMECGIRLAGFEDLKPGDRLVAYTTTSVKRKLI